MLTVVAVDIILTAQEAEARECVNPNAPGGGGIAVNASQGRCDSPGPASADELTVEDLVEDEEDEEDEEDDSEDNESNEDS